MKKIIFITATLLSFLTAQAQLGDTTVAAINFDSTKYLNYITFDTTQSNNCWQVGIPSKTLFDSAYSPNRAIMTDTINPYPTNDTSSFVFHWTMPIYIPNRTEGFLVSFYQKYDFENNKDVGIIEYWNPGYSQWYNIDSIFTSTQDFGFNAIAGYSMANNDTSCIYCYQYWDTNNTVSDLQDSDLKTLPNGLTGFTGKDSIWKHIAIFYSSNMPIRLSHNHQSKSGPEFKLRFTLISDSVQSGNEGWMIDDFKLVRSKSMITSGGIETYKDKKIIKIFPNPAHTGIKLDLGHINNAENAIVQIFDELGRKAQTTRFHYNSKNINISTLNKGIYQIIVRNDNKIIATGRFVKD